MNKNKLLDDIGRLSKGKSTKYKIGSRKIGHRLTQDEDKLLNIALKKGFLETYSHTRDNLLNIYEKNCLARNKKIIIIEHLKEYSEVNNNGAIKQFKTRKEAKDYAKELLT